MTIEKENYSSNIKKKGCICDTKTFNCMAGFDKFIRLGPQDISVPNTKVAAPFVEIIGREIQLWELESKNKESCVYGDTIMPHFPLFS